MSFFLFFFECDRRASLSFRVSGGHKCIAPLFVSCTKATPCSLWGRVTVWWLPRPDRTERSGPDRQQATADGRSPLPRDSVLAAVAVAGRERTSQKSAKFAAIGQVACTPRMAEPAHSRRQPETTQKIQEKTPKRNNRRHAKENGQRPTPTGGGVRRHRRKRKDHKQDGVREEQGVPKVPVRTIMPTPFNEVPPPPTFAARVFGRLRDPADALGLSFVYALFVFCRRLGAVGRQPRRRTDHARCVLATTWLCMGGRRPGGGRAFDGSARRAALCRHLALRLWTALARVARARASSP